MNRLTTAQGKPMIVDLFAGPGGWDEGLRMIGRTDVVGVEWDQAACDTAEAAGHKRIRADVAELNPAMFSKVEGLIASPPCQDFSGAGGKKREAGTTGHLVREGLRWALALRPEWTVWEEVPEVLDVWRECAVPLQDAGYRVWTGVLDAADYGVPQHRRRAILLASRVDSPTPPAPTHTRHATLFGASEPHVTMRAALGWDGTLDRRQNGAPVITDMDRPAPTLTGAAVGSGIWLRRDATGRRQTITLAEASAIQSFPGDYPWQGRTQKERGQQVGNAVPPLLAAHTLAAIGAGTLGAAV